MGSTGNGNGYVNDDARYAALSTCVTGIENSVNNLTPQFSACLRFQLHQTPLPRRLLCRADQFAANGFYAPAQLVGHARAHGLR